MVEPPRPAVGAAVPGGPTDPAPTSLRVATAVLAVQAVAMLGVVVWLAYADLTATTTTPYGALMVTSFAFLMSVTLAVFARALNLRRGWARGPAIVMELLCLPMGYTMVTTGLVWLGLPVMLVGLVGAGALLAPATRTALGVG